MQKFQMIKVTSPSIEFECMGAIIPSQTIESTNKTPNFAEPILERKILVSAENLIFFIRVTSTVHVPVV